MAIAQSTALTVEANDAIIPSPVCFTSRPPESVRPLLTMESCARINSVARRSPRRVVILVEPTNVGEHDRAISGVHIIMGPAGGWLRILDPAQKGFDRRKRNFDNLSCNVPMRIPMHALRG